MASTNKPHADDDVTAFSGFGSWMSSLETQAAPPYDGRRESRQGGGAVHEMDGGHGVVHEMDAGAGAVELPVEDGPGHQVKKSPAQVLVPGGGYGPGPPVNWNPSPTSPISYPPQPVYHHPGPYAPGPQYPQPVPYNPPNSPYNPGIYTPYPQPVPYHAPHQPVYYPPYPTPQPAPAPQPYHPPAPIPQPYVPPAPVPQPYNPPAPVPQPYSPPPQPAPQPIYKPQPAPVPVKRKSLIASKVVFEEVPDPVTRIKVSGLHKSGQQAQFAETVDFSSHCFLEDIAKRLTSSGYTPPLGFATDPKNARTLSIPTGSLRESGWPVLLTTGKSCYNPDIGLRMHVDEPFAVFLTSLQLSVKCVDSRISVNDGDLKIAFHRTLRVPEDGRTHKLPASFGRFPTQNIVAYQKKLVNSKNASLLDMAKKGGVFFPVFQREAMWLSFSAAKGSEYKIRVFVGGVNVVTGKKWDDESKSGPYEDEDQDYILVPPQEHLDGIAVGNGIVQQFIAMPVGSGYSIEKQITGREDVGGVQLEISPRNRSFVFYCRGKEVKWQNSKDPNSAMTPRTSGLHPGELMTITRHGTSDSLPFLGGKLRRQQKRTLRDLVDSKGLVPSVTALVALYPITLQIKIPGTVMKHKITTPPFSPLDNIGTVIQNTMYKGKDLKGYNLAFKNVIGEYETILGAGLYDGAVLTAYKNFKGSTTQAESAPAPESLKPRPHSIAWPPSYQAPNKPSSPASYAAPNYHPSGHNLQPVSSAPTPYGAPASPTSPASQASPQPAVMAASSGMSSPYSRPAAGRPPGMSPSPLQYSQGSSSLIQQSYSSGYHGNTYEAAPSPVQQLSAAPPKTSSPYPMDAASELNDGHGYDVSDAPSYAASRPARQSAPPMGYDAPRPQAPPMSHGALPSSTAYGVGNYASSVSQNAAPDALMSAETPSPVVMAPPARMSAEPPSPVMMAPPQSSTSNVMEVPGPGRGSSPPSAPAYYSNETPTFPQSHSSPPSATSYHTRTSSSPPPPKRPPKIPEQESWAMSLAAGGRLAQQVHLDPTPAAYRSTTPSATALINIQLLNAVAYETLTGLLCPPTPITPKQYAEAGIPWFDTYASDARSTSGGAAFSNLRSVGQIDSASSIEASTSVTESQKVACTSCRRSLCDCVLRPCNHAFCGECVKGRMLEIAYGNRRVARCLVCRAVAEKILGFSAPMALPGYEDFVPDEGAQVLVKAGSFGRGIVFELE